MLLSIIKTISYGGAAVGNPLGAGHALDAAQTALEPETDSDIISGNKTRQGYVLRNTLKPAGYFFLASQKLLRPVL